MNEEFTKEYICFVCKLCTKKLFDNRDLSQKLFNRLRTFYVNISPHRKWSVAAIKTKKISMKNILSLQPNLPDFN